MEITDVAIFKGLCVNHFDFQQREEKQLEASVESLISRVAHLKNSLQSFIFKLENEYDRLTW